MPRHSSETLTPLSAAILFALAGGASHGYAIIKEIEQLTDGQMRPNTGSMYLALQRLVEGWPDHAIFGEKRGCASAVLQADRRRP